MNKEKLLCPAPPRVIKQDLGPRILYLVYQTSHGLKRHQGDELHHILSRVRRGCLGFALDNLHDDKPANSEKQNETI